ncbi:MAG: protein translocase subunit SecDF [Bacteroidetes bacterium]|nr:protein translocase subunit SecDF [Bacteroidota bacterium]MDA0885463.1 protein translocase subunit SecDF [Bacteroidota bacterium]MDA1225613.1 protein translocase subunit SecDF [Bacteroidota bacterium]
MQGNSLIKTFAILFSLVSIYQLSFTFISSTLENKAKNAAIQKISEDEISFAEKRASEEVRFLDSIGDFPVLMYSSYNDAKQKELNQGLDLKGGINVILQISIKDLLKGLAENSSNPKFLKALDDADELQKQSDQTYLESFFEAFDSSNDQTKLTSPEIFGNRTLSSEVSFDTSDDDMRSILNSKIDESIVSAFEVLRKRIDKFGVTQPNIQRLGTSGRILIELPGAKDIDRIQNLLQSTAQLEFWETYKNDDFSEFLVSANEYLSSSETINNQSESSQSDIDDLLSEVEQTSDSIQNTSNPLLGLVKAFSFQGSPILARFLPRDQDIVNSYLSLPEVRKLLPRDYRFTKFLWGKVDQDGLTSLYAIKSNREDLAPLSGGVVVDASQSYDAVGNPAVSMQMNAQGARIWENLTDFAYRQNSNIAIVLDDIVYSAPGVTRGAISGGRSEITGDFDLNEAIDLANVLRAGKLPASASIIQSEVVGPSLGQEAIDSGIDSFLIALTFVLVWMIFYYGPSGIFADIALILNILLIFGILAGLGAVLTLPGIAGIVLTIGISVDANVLIFERVREELKKEKGLKQSINDGFNNALSSILDANITTGLTALVLYIFGTGPIKGFATTLLIGIATSLFTAIFITRLLIDNKVFKSGKLEFSTKSTKNLFTNLKIKFLGKRKATYVISSILVLISLSSLLFQGLNQGVDFLGGRSYIVRFDKEVKSTDIESTLNDVFGSAEVKTFGASNQLKITTKYKVEQEGLEVDNEIKNILFENLNSIYTNPITYDEFSSGNQVGIMSSIKVGPTIADDIKQNSVWAILGSLVIVFFYILLRFQKWQFSLGAVSAVFHDVLIVLGIFSLTYKIMPFNMEINQAFIAALLTVIGYSLNDTVVVFDRIREFFKIHSSWDNETTVNTALNSTLSRTLNTSLTTLIVLIAIFIFGGESIRGFMFALIIGVMVGTYSSVFIATPIMFDSFKNKN